MNGGLENDVPIGEMARAGVADSKHGKRTPPVAARPPDRAATGDGADRQPGSWSRFFATDSGNHALALMDQAVVSGTSFLTTDKMGRHRILLRRAQSRTAPELAHFPLVVSLSNRSW